MQQGLIKSLIINVYLWLLFVHLKIKGLLNYFYIKCYSSIIYLNFARPRDKKNPKNRNSTWELMLLKFKSSLNIFTSIYIWLLFARSKLNNIYLQEIYYQFLLSATFIRFSLFLLRQLTITFLNYFHFLLSSLCIWFLFSSFFNILYSFSSIVCSRIFVWFYFYKLIQLNVFFYTFFNLFFCFHDKIILLSIIRLLTWWSMISCYDNVQIT